MEPIVNTFFDRCDLYERGFIEEKDRQKEALVLKSKQIPCALSYLERQQPKEGEADFAEYFCRLFLPAGTIIPAGSALMVFHQGTALWFESTGEQKCYPTHGEVTVKRRKEF